MFKTQYQSHDRVIAHSGSRTKILYGPIFDDRGVMSLMETGVHDLYAEIQSHADSVDIHVILERFAKGDPGALSRVQGAYGDFTQMPRTFAEALNTFVAAEQYFLGLPLDVRASFGHDFRQFLASMDQPDFASRVGWAPDHDQVSDTVSNPGTGSVLPPESSSTLPSAPPAPSSEG